MRLSRKRWCVMRQNSLTGRESLSKGEGRWTLSPEPERKKEGQPRSEKLAAWENDLLHQYGPEEYAAAIDRLAADPDLVEHATRAEMESPAAVRWPHAWAERARGQP